MFKRMIHNVVVMSVILLGTSFHSIAFAQVEIETWHTSKGAKVLFVESKQLPMLDIKVTFDAGSSRDGKDWGLASITSGLIGTATSTLNEDQISQGFDELGAQIGSGISRDNASLSLRTLTRPQIMQKALPLFAQVLTDAKFDQVVFDREMKRLELGLKERQVKPQVISNDILWQALYGKHPYGHPISGTLETVASINIEKVNQFYQQFYVTNNAVIAIVGNVSREQAEEIAEQLTKKLPKGQKPIALPQPKVVKQKTINKEFDSTQTYYSLIQHGVERGHPDYVPLFVGNHLLGGNGFGSMLMEEVREKRGLVYSVYSYFIPLRVKGPFIIGLSTKNTSAYEADKVVKQTFTDFLSGISDEKLTAIKENLVGGFPLRIDSNSKIMGYLSMIGAYDLPLDYLDWFPKEVTKVTKQDVLDAWKRNINTNEMIRVMVGNPKE